MERILALDVGDRRIGIAVTDPLMIMALPYETYNRKNLKTDVEYIATLIKDKQALKVICGLPLTLDGNEGEQVEKNKVFIEELKKLISVPIELIDERFTTVSADRLLLEADMKRKDRKQVVDKVAASFILENYMNKIKSKEKG